MLVHQSDHCEVRRVRMAWQSDNECDPLGLFSDHLRNTTCRWRVEGSGVREESYFTSSKNPI